MTGKQKIKFLLEDKKRFIDSILESIDKYENTSVQDIEELVNLYISSKFYFRDNEVIEILNEIKQKIESTSRSTCKFSKENEAMIQLLVPSTFSERKARDSGLKEIRDFTWGAKELIIIDPYLFSGATKDAESYLNDFKRSSRIDGNSLRKLHIIYNSKYPLTQSIKRGIKRLAEQNDCTISSIGTDLIHDRIWIKDKNNAIVVGTSFGTLGKRVCFILELPKHDLESLLKMIKKNNLLTNTFA